MVDPFAQSAPRQAECHRQGPGCSNRAGFRSRQCHASQGCREECQEEAKVPLSLQRSTLLSPVRLVCLLEIVYLI